MFTTKKNLNHYKFLKNIKKIINNQINLNFLSKLKKLKIKLNSKNIINS